MILPCCHIRTVFCDLKGSFSCATNAELLSSFQNISAISVDSTFLSLPSLFSPYGYIFPAFDQYLSFSIIPCSFSLQFCSLHTSPFSCIFTVTEVDPNTTQLLKLDILFETSAPKNYNPEYFSIVALCNNILSKSRRITALSTGIRR